MSPDPGSKPTENLTESCSFTEPTTALYIPELIPSKSIVYLLLPVEVVVRESQARENSWARCGLFFTPLGLQCRQKKLYRLDEKNIAEERYYTKHQSTYSGNRGLDV